MVCGFLETGYRGGTGETCAFSSTCVSFERFLLRLNALQLLLLLLLLLLVLFESFSWFHSELEPLGSFLVICCTWLTILEMLRTENSVNQHRLIKSVTLFWRCPIESCFNFTQISITYKLKYMSTVQCTTDRVLKFHVESQYSCAWYKETKNIVENQTVENCL